MRKRRHSSDDREIDVDADATKRPAKRFRPLLDGGDGTESSGGPAHGRPASPALWHTPCSAQPGAQLLGSASWSDVQAAGAVPAEWRVGQQARWAQSQHDQATLMPHAPDGVEAAADVTGQYDRALRKRRGSGFVSLLSQEQAAADTAEAALLGDDMMEPDYGRRKIRPPYQSELHRHNASPSPYLYSAASSAPTSPFIDNQPDQHADESGAGHHSPYRHMNRVLYEAHLMRLQTRKPPPSPWNP